MAPCAYVCDFGEREAFETEARSQGILKIYDKINPNYMELKRIDVPCNIDITKNTARFTAFYDTNTNLIHCKFGCVYCLNSKKLFKATDTELLSGFKYFLNKYAKKHFNEESLELLATFYFKSFDIFKKKSELFVRGY